VAASGMNIKTIADALAARFVNVTAVGETAPATASLPNNISTLALLVYPPEGDLSYLMGGPKLNAHLTFPVRLLRDPLSVPERTDALLAWATVLWPLPMGNFDLDVAGVIEAETTHIHIELDGQSYAGALFDVVELTVDVHVYELVTFS
jgi:hypothetical protein